MVLRQDPCRDCGEPFGQGHVPGCGREVRPAVAPAPASAVETIRLRTNERRTMVAELRRAGLRVRTIADRVGANQTTVTSDLAALRQAGVDLTPSPPDVPRCRWCGHVRDDDRAQQHEPGCRSFLQPTAVDLAAVMAPPTRQVDRVNGPGGDLSGLGGWR